MKYIFGNWKMYLNTQQSIDLAREFAQLVQDGDGVEYAVFPNTLAFYDVAAELKNSPVATGAQNVGWTPQGAYTGSTSAFMFSDAGAKYALVGHSERRHVFGETNEDVRKRLEASIDVGLTPVLCIGETKEDRDADKTEYRLKKQLLKAFENLSLNGNRVIVAYEPVWAIGTGDACVPEEAQRVINLIKQEIKQYVDTDVPVLYGGSVSADNVVSYVSLPDIDGVLVGGASSKAESFMTLINNAISA
ncbi:triose-phosphate isomerase [Candidatus Parcubacteria bacterium]|nr:MAG: triose-phosphate isomerase [Candidatus Parcubacteria bacterium]